MVDHVEGLLELLDLILVEHGEHIAEEVNTSGGNYRPCFRENQPKRSFSIK
jgi:hypothetical protein